MIEQLLWGFVGGFLGAICALALAFKVAQRQHPYHYVCPHPDCYFEARSNDMGLLDYIATSHEQHTLHGGGN